jgi:hypothetical protein
LTENKFSKYLLYAIGEIVLVVIGILLALQINNWNDQRSTEANNKIYLKKLIHELELNNERLAFLAYQDESQVWDPSIKQVVSNCDSMLSLTAKGLTREDLDFVLNAEFHAGGSQLSLFSDTYEELLNTGKLYSLGRDSMVIAIKDYYKRYEREIEYKQRSAAWTREGIALMEDSYGLMKTKYDIDPGSFSLDDYPWYFDQNSTAYRGLLKGIKRMRDAQLQDLKKCEEIMDYTEKLIHVIQGELKFTSAL